MGETLTDIARRYHTTVNALVSESNIGNSNKMNSGAKLNTVMKKHFRNFSIIILLIPLIGFLSFSGKPQDTGYTPKDGFVPDKETAIRIAEVILAPIYGDAIKEQKPLNVELKNDSVWVVTGTLNSDLGGVAHIEIRKSDCKILHVEHGK